MPASRISPGRALRRGLWAVAALWLSLGPALSPRPVAAAPPAQAAPPPAAADPGFSLLILSDPQLPWWREGDDPDCDYDLCRDLKAGYTNSRMVESLNAVTNLGRWPDGARRGDGAALNPPKGVVVNGDLTAFFHQSQLDLFDQHYGGSKVKYPLYLGLGNHEYENNLNDCSFDSQFHEDTNRCAKEAVWWMGRRLDREMTGITNRDWPTFVSVYNGGGFDMRFAVVYDLDGQQPSKRSDRFAAGQSRGLTVPWGATNVRVTMEVWNGSAWNDIGAKGGNRTLATAKTSCWRVSGTLGLESVDGATCPDEWPSGTSGSLAYSFDVDSLEGGFGVHVVQLHYHPAYAVDLPQKYTSVNNGAYEIHQSPGVNVTTSFDWLKKDLSAATAAGRVSIINLHDLRLSYDSPPLDPAGVSGYLPTDQALRDAIAGQNVVAFFGGHYHADYGFVADVLSGSRRIPFFRSGSVECETFLAVDFRARYFKVGVVGSNGGPKWVPDGTSCENRVEYKKKDGAFELDANGQKIPWAYSHNRAWRSAGTFLYAAEAPAFSVQNLSPGSTIFEGQTLAPSARGTGTTGNFLTYTWDFGDGTTVKGDQPTHVYEDEGSGAYTVRVTAEDGFGQQGAQSFPLTVLNARPRVQLAAGQVSPAGDVTVTGSISDWGVKDAHTVRIDWGDGAQQEVALPAGTPTFEWRHVYSGVRADPTAAYEVKVTVTDGDGGEGTATATVARKAPRLTAPESVAIPPGGQATVAGTLASADATDTFTLDIDWGDGTHDSAPYAAGTTAYRRSHTYAAVGPDRYQIRLTATDDEGGVAGAVASGVRTASAAPQIRLAAYDLGAKEGEPVVVSGTVDDPWGDVPMTVELKWGDGASDTVALAPDATTFSLAHAYADNRPEEQTYWLSYWMVITLTTEDGRSKMTNATAVVANVAPTLTAETEPTVLEGALATVRGTVADPGAADRLTLAVDWGDGQSDSQALPAGAASYQVQHRYPDDRPGTTGDTYSVRLTLTDDDGGRSSATVPVTVVNAPPVLTTVLKPKAVDEGQSTSLSGTVADPGADSFTVTIGWGDGTSQTIAVPAGEQKFGASHRYPDNPPPGAAGVFVVSVRAEDDDGSRGVATMTVEVRNVAPGGRLDAPPAVKQGQPFELKLSAVHDPSEKDAAAGFAIAFD